jgi:hypothetical protein
MRFGSAWWNPVRSAAVILRPAKACGSTVLSQNFCAGGDAFAVIKRAGGDALEIGFHSIDLLILFMSELGAGSKGGLGIHAQGLIQGVRRPAVHAVAFVMIS